MFLHLSVCVLDASGAYLLCVTRGLAIVWMWAGLCAVARMAAEARAGLDIARTRCSHRLTPAMLRSIASIAVIMRPQQPRPRCR
jgi:hypothetical protein